jgi:hypothetical protein
MARCPSCEYPLPEDRERLGARCPQCRDPLYEPPGRVSRPARPQEGACAVHDGRESVGTCDRCGNYLCEVCRTPWRGQVVCAACAERALEAGEAAPEQTRAHTRQAVLAVGLGLATWVLAVLFFIVIAVGQTGGQPVLVLLGVMALGADTIVAALGMGQAVAALRLRGPHMIVATAGMILCGLYMGALIGLFSFSVWSV